MRVIDEVCRLGPEQMEIFGNGRPTKEGDMDNDEESERSNKKEEGDDETEDDEESERSNKKEEEDDETEETDEDDSRPSRPRPLPANLRLPDLCTERACCPGEKCYISSTKGGRRRIAFCAPVSKYTRIEILRRAQQHYFISVGTNHSIPPALDFSNGTMYYYKLYTIMHCKSC